MASKLAKLSVDERERLAAVRKKALEASEALEKVQKEELEHQERQKQLQLARQLALIEAEELKREETFRKREEAREVRKAGNAPTDPFAPDFLLRKTQKTSTGTITTEQDEFEFSLPPQALELALPDEDPDIQEANQLLASLATEIRRVFAPAFYQKLFKRQEVVNKYYDLLQQKDVQKSSTSLDLFKTKQSAPNEIDESTKIHNGMRTLEEQLRLLPELHLRALNECADDQERREAVEVFENHCVFIICV